VCLLSPKYESPNQIEEKLQAGFITRYYPVFSYPKFCSKPADWQLEKMPVKLETDFALTPFTIPAGQRCCLLLDPNKAITWP